MQRSKLQTKKQKKTIKKIHKKNDFFVDPHTATGFHAANKIKNKYPCIVLGTAHPYKFLETMIKATGKKIKKPPQLSKLMAGKEKYNVLSNKINIIKKYILEKHYEN